MFRREVQLTNYAQIPTHLICRFGELTKTEIVVISYLYAVRNRKTGQCNPSRSTIARAVGIDRAHVSPAVKSLDQKEWICEMPDGNFQLTEPSERCADSAQAKVTESAQGGVRNPQQDRAESVTKVCGIRTGHIYDSSEQRNEQKIEQREREEPDPPASSFASPVVNQKTLKTNHPALIAVRDLTGHQPDRATWDGLIEILGLEPDLPRLSKCYSAWVMRGFRKANYGWVTDWYASNEIPERKNGKTQLTNDDGLTHDQRVLQESAEFYRNYPN